MIATTLLSVFIGFLLVSPLLTETGSFSESSSQDAGRQLLDRKERALQILRDLELDHATGKLVDSEFEMLRDQTRVELSAILEQIESHGR